MHKKNIFMNWSIPKIRYDVATKTLKMCVVMTDDHTTLAACRALCTAWLRPVVRLSLGFGIKYQDFTSITKKLFIEEALRESNRNKKLNISQIASRTGLQRKELTERLLLPSEHQTSTERSWPAQVFSQWRQWVMQEPTRRTLPIVSNTGAISFAELARLVSKGTMHHRAILNELIRIKLVAEHDEQVTLLEDALVPSEDLQLLMSFASDNGHDHLQAITANVLGRDPRFFEQAIFSAQIKPEDCVAAQHLLREHWQTLQFRMLDLLTRAEQNAEFAQQPLERLRLGVYLYHTPDHSSDAIFPPSGSLEDRTI
jgi:hypothetical protein